MPRKQRFKPTRKPKLTNEGAIERTQEPPILSTGDETLRSTQPPQTDEERRTE
jgi:hypothetical protein